jgi:pimeloyl-ACP methyl ester carboxylesterase
VKLHVVSDGDGAPVLLLHGFPESWWTWRHQIAALAGAGFCAIAPDQRGYGQSDKPRGVSSYQVDKLLGDLDGLLDALGHRRVTVVGHDWGGALAWSYAALRPERVAKLVIMNSPHPTLFMQRYLWRLAQLRKSWYMFFFILPSLPERWVLRRGFIERILKSAAVNRDAISGELVARYDAEFRRPGVATAAINWYRAAMTSRRAPLPKINAPTKIIWGAGDPVLGPELLDGIEEWVADVSIHLVPGAGHWVESEAPDEVNRELIAFLRR